MHCRLQVTLLLLILLLSPRELPTRMLIDTVHEISGLMAQP